MKRSADINCRGPLGTPPTVLVVASAIALLTMACSGGSSTAADAGQAVTAHPATTAPPATTISATTTPAATTLPATTVPPVAATLPATTTSVASAPETQTDESDQPDASASAEQQPGAESDAEQAPESAAPQDDSATPATTAPVQRSDPSIPTESLSEADLLQLVMDRGWLNCGVSGSFIAFSEFQPDGRMLGFDADFCRAVAAAILGDSEAVEFVWLTAAERFRVLQEGEIDLLMRHTTWTQHRDSELGLDFGPTTFYDGQQVMARAGDGFTAASTIRNLAGAVVCTNRGPPTAGTMAAAAEEAGIDVIVRTYDDFDQVTDNFISGACDAITTDGVALVGRRVRQQGDQRWVIFPSRPFSREPLGPVYRQDQARFGDVVNWTVYATIIADMHGVTSQNIDSLIDQPTLHHEVMRLLGGEREQQSSLGLAADAFYSVIRQVGNYDEIYARNFGPAGLTRDGTLNALWSDGGLIYAPPAR